MIIKLITDSRYKEEWNNVVTHPLQTWEWGEIKKESGNQILRVGQFNDQGVLIMGYLITLHSLPFGYQMAFLAKSVWPKNEVLQFLKKELIKINCLFLKLETETLIEETGVYQLPILKKHFIIEDLDFYLSNSRVFAPATFLLDLEFSEKELLERMKSKTRYNLHLAEKKGVVIKDETENKNGFLVFFTLYQETVKRQNYLGHKQDYHQLVWNTLKNKVAKILVAYYNNEPLAAYEIFIFKNRAYYLYGGSTQEHKELMAANLLMWEAIKLAKNSGCQYFDLWGALPKNYNQNDPWAGFHRFKEGYGATHQTYLPTIDLVFNNFYYELFSFIWPIRTKILELKQKFFL